MITIDETNLEEVRKGIDTLREAQKNLQQDKASSRLEGYRKKYLGKWIICYPRDLDTYKPKQNDEFVLIKVKEIETIYEICGFQDQLEVIYEPNSYLSIEDGEIREISYYDEDLSVYSNCIEVVDGQFVHNYIDRFKEKVDKILANI